jgi:hypothetical protein
MKLYGEALLNLKSLIQSLYQLLLVLVVEQEIKVII